MPKKLGAKIYLPEFVKFVNLVITMILFLWNKISNNKQNIEKTINFTLSLSIAIWMEQKKLIGLRNPKNESGYCGKSVVIRILHVEKDDDGMYPLP